MEDGKVSGFISRFGDADSDKGQFIDQFFDKASLAGDRLSFKTKTVHGVWYEFTGVINITPGKQPGQEDYRVIKGTLTQHTIDADSHDKATQRGVEFKVVSARPEQAVRQLSAISPLSVCLLVVGGMGDELALNVSHVAVFHFGEFAIEPAQFAFRRLLCQLRVVALGA